MTQHVSWPRFEATRIEMTDGKERAMITIAQQRLLDVIASYGDCAEYWPVVNDWVRSAGPAQALALRNINRTVAALIRAGYIAVDDDGLFQLKRKG